MELLEVLLLIPLFYVYGSIPFGVIFTYLVKREIIYEKGNRDISVTRVFMIGGVLAGALTVIGEISKVAIPLISAKYFFEGSVTVSLAFISATLVGSMLSIFLKGRGGHGFTVVLWSLLLLSPVTLILFLLIFFTMFFTTRIISKGRHLPDKIVVYKLLLSLFILPVLLLIIERSLPFLLFGILYATLFNLTLNLNIKEEYRTTLRKPSSKKSGDNDE